MEIAPQEYSAHGISFVVRKEHAMIGNMMGLLGGELHPYVAMSGLFRLIDESGVYDGRDMDITWFSHTDDEETAEVKFVAENEITELTMLFTYKDGVWSRKDSLRNKKSEPSTISCIKQRFLLRGENYEVFMQQGAWNTENQGSFKPVLSGGAMNCNRGPRTCENGQPFMSIRTTNQKNGVSFVIMPNGKWEMKAESIFNSYCPCVKVEMGLPEAELSLVLEPGETVDLPEILFYSYKGGDESLGSEKLHTFLIKNRIHNKELPVYWNSWFFDFDHLDYDKFVTEAETAAEIGCEYFVVDAGWFGDGNWEASVGSWRETETSAFYGKMKDLADHVRKLGMKFGLWIEPERVVINSDFFNEHRDWMTCFNGHMGMANFALPEVREYFSNILDGLIEKYGIEFIKFDMNVEGDKDESGTHFYRYYQGYFKFHEEFRKRHPEVYCEFCSSGGLRSDTRNVCAADAHFLSDTINPFEGLYLLQGTAFRVPSSMISKWHGTIEADLPRPAIGEPKKHILACADALWERCIEVDHTFMEAFMMLGPWGFTSKISNYTDEYKALLKKSVEIYKEMRGLVKNAAFRTLTPIKDKYDAKGPVIFQLSDVYEDRHLLAIFHLEEYTCTVIAQPKGISPDKNYRVRTVGAQLGNDGYIMSGKKIIECGVAGHLFGYKYTGLLIEISEVK